MNGPPFIGLGQLQVLGDGPLEGRQERPDYVPR